MHARKRTEMTEGREAKRRAEALGVQRWGPALSKVHHQDFSAKSSNENKLSLHADKVTLEPRVSAARASLMRRMPSLYANARSWRIRVTLPQ
jgi:hypothetical protein